MRVVSSRVPQNAFERTLLATIGAFGRLDGIVTNNVILPHPMRNLPNEHDIIVLLTGKLVTIDAKELWPGTYRDTASGWEHERRGRWRRVEGFSHPMDIAFKKGKVAEKLVKARLGPGASIPEVLSCIVVPDACDVSGLGAGRAGRTALGARMLMVRLSELEDALLADAAEFARRRPSPDELAGVLGIEHLSDADPVACSLADDLEVTELLEHRPRPVPRDVYLGLQHSPRRRRVRVEVCPYASDDRTAEALMRAHRSHLLALQEAACPGIIRLFDHRITPTATLFVHEFFSRTTLMDAVERAPLPWPVARPLIAGLVAVFDALHAAGVVHRYLDPSSVLLAGSPPQDLRVCDFFGAAALDTSTLGQDQAASPFDPPERRADAPPHRTMDWYSVGRCLRYMLTGDPFGWPAEDVPAPLAGCLHGLESPPPARAAAWRGLSTLVAG